MPIVASRSADSELPAILIEVDGRPDDNPYGAVRSNAAERVLESARDVFGDGLDLVRACAGRMSEMVAAMVADPRLDEISVQLAVKLDSEVGAMIAKASAGAQFQVELKWKCRPDASAAQGDS